MRSADRSEKSSALYAKSSGILAGFGDIGFVSSDRDTSRESLCACHGECWSYRRRQVREDLEKQAQDVPLWFLETRSHRPQPVSVMTWLAKLLGLILIGVKSPSAGIKAQQSV